MNNNNNVQMFLISYVDMKAAYASNNWLRNHNYPSRRKDLNRAWKKYKSRQKSRYIFDEFAELCGYDTQKGGTCSTLERKDENERKK